MLKHPDVNRNRIKTMRYYFRQRIAGIAHVLDIIRRVILSLIFWGIIIAVIAALIVNHTPSVKPGSILVVNPRGTLVDAYTSPVSYRGIPLGGVMNETLLDDLVTAIDMASTDSKIIGLWIDLNNLYPSGAAATGELAEAVKRFSASGKKIICSADSYDNGRYRIASSSDWIVVDRLGEVFPSGYGYWRAYYAEGLDKFGIKADLFRSGESKAAAENFILDGMSDAARRDETRLLGDLWETWLGTVAENRGISSGELENWIDNYDLYLAEAGGNGAQSALDAGLVDLIETGGVLENLLDSQFGNDESRRIDALDYVRSEYPRHGGKETIAVVPIVGTLVYGNGTASQAGSSDIAQAINNAADTRGVGAIVLRIDSPGGDVRAGEEVRRAVAKIKKDYGLPIVVSMGNLAASGGYWIAAESDLIVTDADTITGSIGVYSMSLSFEEALSRWLGVRIDGFGTTPWSGMENPGRSMDERTASLYASSVKDIDSMFRNLVAEKRGLTAEQVDELAGGIPWSGSRAVDLGLADTTGGLKEAREAAAELAGFSEWNVLYFDKKGDSREELLSRILWGKQGGRASVSRSMWQTSILLHLRRSNNP